MKLNTIAGIALAGICSLWTVNAFADDSVAVMKFDSLGSDTDDKANFIFEALRTEVNNSSTKLEANGGDITYTEMQAVTGCDTESSIACYDVACETLGAPAIIFGSVEEGGVVKIVWYVSGKGIFREVSGTITDENSARVLARDMIVGEMGTLIVTTNVPDAEIFIDGKSYGLSTTPDDTAKPIELVAGNYIVSIRKDGFNREDAAKITIEGHKTATYHLDLTVAADPEEIKRGMIYAGYPILGLGVAGLVLGGVMELMMSKAQSELNDFKFMNADDPGKKAKELNDNGKKYEQIKLYSYIGGSIFAAAGAALLIVAYVYDWTGEKATENLNNESGGGDDEEELSFIPKVNFQVSPEYQGMTMGWTF